MICKHCKKPKEYHLANTFACPVGRKTRIGYTTFSTTVAFETTDISNWLVYILKCGKNDTIYTGITKDIHQRVKDHVSGKGAKYTRAFKPKAYMILCSNMSHSEAAKLERRLKKFVVFREYLMTSGEWKDI